MSEYTIEEMKQAAVMLFKHKNNFDFESLEYEILWIAFSELNREIMNYTQDSTWMLKEEEFKDKFTT